MKPNDKRFDSANGRTDKTSKHKKTQSEFYAKSVFDELELVMEINTSSRTSHG
jgi:hypothetical protein